MVATPGRLMDHMKRRTIRLHKVETVVLDEADRMLDMGFIKDVTRILKQIPHRRNLGMFSATISREVMDISWVYQRDPVEIVVRPVQENRPQIQQYRIKVDQGGKVDLLIAILEKEATGPGHRLLQHQEHHRPAHRPAPDEGGGRPGIHGDLSQKVREKVPPSAPGTCGCWWPPTWPPVGWTSTTWTPSSITTSPKRGILCPPHRPHRPGQAPGGGLQPDLLGDR